MILSKKSVILILISTFLINTAAMVVYTYTSTYLLYLGTSKSLMQLIVTIFPLTAFCFPPLYGFLSDKYQNRIVFLLIGTFGMIFAFVMLSLTRDLIFTTLFLFLFGFFMASSNISFTLYSELVEDDKKYVSYLNAIIVAGWFIGAQFGGIVIDIYGIENIFLLVLSISLPNIICVVLIRENRPMILESYNNRVNKKLNDLNTNVTEVENSISKSIYYGLFFRNFSIKPIMPILALLMISYLGNRSEVGFLIGINFFLQFFLMLLAGKIITSKNVKMFMVMGYTLSSLTIFGYIISTSFFIYFFFQLIFAFSYSMHWAATIVYITQNTTPKNKGQIIGYANASVFSGSFVGGLFFTLLLSFNPNYYMAMSFMIIFPIISVVIISLKFKPKR
ncbi:MAG: MFS transporter [Candidatus Lokiarchaeota archaeon]|nr:MFS transporter [Candidatus Lokiarchaeota archaeon]